MSDTLSISVPSPASGMLKPGQELPPEPGQPNTPPTPPAEPAPVTPPAEPPAPPAELDLTPFEKEYAETGKLSDETFEKLKTEHRLPRALIEGYIAHRHAQVQQFQTEVMQSVGGQEQYTKLTQWAAEKLPAAETEAYNQVMQSGNPETIKLAVAGLNAKFTAQHGQAPKLVGGAPGPSGPAPYRSLGEVTAAMRDPRYQTDEAYRNEVIARLDRSDVYR